MRPTAVNISESPKITNCGVIQKMEITLFSSTYEFLLLFSIRAAKTMEKVATKRPNPILCRGWIPDSWPVIFLAKGTKKAS
ncbi:hypothetical protein RHGRI_032122 [Rhododendron griersonianum]|uniref:Uncharacterized protein n=1 Tax=Rhododendron griersonianum TaxID=479676 RepID=A0AAV6ICZ7_9ERIC|nr:hypothetical protein RHGRI_032122 [Rhododendron griersonianum]